MGFGVTGKLGGYYLAEQYRKNGAVGKSGGGGNISCPTAEQWRQFKAKQQRQFKAEQEAKKIRRKHYLLLNEKAALKRKLMEQEANERYYKTSTTKKTVSAYEKNLIESVERRV